MIYLASLVNDTDFVADGRRLETLGLADLTPAQLQTYLQTGRKP